MEAHSPVKTQLRTQNVMLSVFRNMKGPIAIDFLEKKGTINIDSIVNALSKIRFICWMTLFNIYYH